MLKAVNLTKKFDDLVAVDHINAEIKSGSVFGLIGTNGAGKSTFLRLAAGILKADEGHVTIDGEEVFENIKAKKKFFYIPDDAHFFSNASPLDMMEYYSVVYERFDKARFHKLMGNFGLDEKRKIHTFSKGMKKQVSVILGICSNTDYLFCDETFDGLDPVMRDSFKRVLSQETCDRGLITVLAGHNQQEMEDICDSVGFLHEGKLVRCGDLDSLLSDVQKVQFIPGEALENSVLDSFSPLRVQRQGQLIVLTVRSRRFELEEKLRRLHPLFLEFLPLSLEEIFILEMEDQGYAK